MAFIDILHGHGHGNLRRDFSQWKGPGPGLLPDLETVFESPPCFALADALMAADATTEPSPTGVDQIVRFVERRLDGIDPVWKTESQIVRNQHSQMLDVHVSPLLRNLGYESTETGYERSSNSGVKVQLDVTLSAKSSGTHIGFYVHAGLAIPEQIYWDQHWLGRFNPQLTLPRNAAEEWFAVTRDPPEGFASDDEALERLHLNPWFYAAESAAECGRHLATVLAQEISRLDPLLDRNTLIESLIQNEAGLEPLIIGLLPTGRHDMLEEYLTLADHHADPRYHDLAAWARIVVDRS